GRERGNDGAALAEPAAAAAAAGAAVAALAGVGFVAAEEAVAEVEDRTAGGDGTADPAAADPAVVARAARAAVAADGEVAGEEAVTHGGLGVVFDLQGTARGHAAVAAVRGGDDVDLVGGEGTVRDGHGGLAQVAEEARLVLVRLDGAA